jgi:PhnB protein
MSTYTDVYVMPVKAAKLEDYKRFAVNSRKVWLAHGALSVTEFIADDAKLGVHTSFPQSVKLEADEIVAVAILTFRSRDDCARIKAAVMKDPVFADMTPDTIPVDGKRMFFGGFVPFVGDVTTTVAPAVQPYLFFRGRCEEAINFYSATLGAEVLMMMRFKENPDKPGHQSVPKELDEKIMHASLRIAGSEIMMSDGMKTGPLDFECMSLSLAVSNEAEADRLFEALAQDGAVQMPMGPTFFAKRFGAVSDKFGVSWMIMMPTQA